MVVDARGSCFRHEATAEAGRLQSFRMREFVCAGGPALVASWREERLARAAALLERLGLRPTVAAASDPFFTRGHRMMAMIQESERQKLELRVALPGATGGSTAVASLNMHKDHFAKRFDIRQSEEWQTACVGFGLERLTLALLAVHGPDLMQWPLELRDDQSQEPLEVGP